MDSKDKEGRADRRSGYHPTDSGSIGKLQSPHATRDPAFDCCCNDQCNGDVYGPHCTADLGDDLDALIASTRANPSTATYLDLPCDGMACDVDGDPDRDDGSDRDDCDNAATDTRP